MSFIDMMAGREADVSRDQIGDYVERTLRGEMNLPHTREHKLLRRALGMVFLILADILPAEHPARAAVAQAGQMPTEAQIADLLAASAKLDAADDLVDALVTQADLRRSAWDYEDARSRIALPALQQPAEGEATDAYQADIAARAQAQAVLDAAASATLELVAQRDADHAAKNPQPEEQAP